MNSHILHLHVHTTMSEVSETFENLCIASPVKAEQSQFANLFSMVVKMNERIDDLTKEVNELKKKDHERELKAKEFKEKAQKDFHLKTSDHVIIKSDSGIVAVTGTSKVTFKIKEVLKNNGAKWSRKNNRWEFKESEMDIEEVEERVSAAVDMLCKGNVEIITE